MGATPVHLVAVNAPMTSRWDWVIACVCVCVCQSHVCEILLSPKRSSSFQMSFPEIKCLFVLCVPQVCDGDQIHPPNKKISSSQIVYNLTGINVENYLMTTANYFIRNRWFRRAAGMYPLHASSMINNALSSTKSSYFYNHAVLQQTLNFIVWSCYYMLL